MEALRHTHRNDRSIRNVAGYKEAYDIICNLSPEGDGGEVTFDVSPREEWLTPHSLPLVARNIEYDFWENTIQKTVIKPDDNTFTDAELAGAILWGMIFWGFTVRDKWSQFDRTLYYYEEQLMSLKGELYIKYLRDKKLKRQLKKDGMPDGTAFTMEVWNEIHQRQKHQNRSKRRRYHRIRQRIDQLKRLDKRQHLINRLQEVIAPMQSLHQKF